MSAPATAVTGVAETAPFLNALAAGKPDELHLLVWTLPDKQSHWFRRVGDAIDFAASTDKHDLYIGVGLSGQDYGASRRCRAEEVAGIVGLWADLDLKSNAHSKSALPVTVEEALTLLPPNLPPTFIVWTGNGLHAWWLFREPWIFSAAEERREAEELSYRWQTALKLSADANGWTFDRLADLSRILRIPGTKNCKDPANLRAVRIYSQTDRRYNQSDLIEYLDERGVPGHDTASSGVLAAQVDGPLIVDLKALVPEDFLQRSLATDERFRQTWEGQRTDLKDSSKTGYDLALANFGYSAGLGDQEVVNLIIHRRRSRGLAQRTTLDYYRRTLSTAKKGREMEVLNIPATMAPQADCALDSDEAKALICERISNAIGIPILRIVKVDGQSPTYRVELESGKVIFPSLDKLASQASFRLKIAGLANRYPNKMSAKAWEQISQLMLEALTVLSGGDETTIEGTAMHYLERYLGDRPLVEPDETTSPSSRQNPTICEGRIAICLFDFHQHIKKLYLADLAVNQVTAMLSAIGAEAFRFKAGVLRDQSRWLLPISSFPPEKWTESNDASPS